MNVTAGCVESAVGASASCWPGVSQMTRNKSRTLVALAALALYGCADDEIVAPRPPVDIAFASVVQGEYWKCAECDTSYATVFLFADQGSWQSFWDGSSTDIGQNSPPPVVDFERETVLVLLDKVEPESAEIEVESVRRELDRIVVRATLRTGCQGWLLPSPPFRPYHIVRISRRVAPVDLNVTVVPCP